MNKIVNINLGGYPFIIDNDAFSHLDKYISTIRRHFSSSEGCEEIVSDIEVRMAEILNETDPNRKIITKKELEEVIKIMGTPEDFGAASMDDDIEVETPRSSKSRKRRRSGRRLFRDEDDKVIGGVCAGLASYFGFSDPLWMRLIWLVFIIFGGIGFMPYLILWIIVPKAKSAGDKLAMKGEPVNVENIGRIIEEEIDNLSDKVTEFGKSFESKKKGLVDRDSSAFDPPYRKGFLY